MKAPLLLVLLALVVFSCERPPKYADTPFIEFREISVIPKEDFSIVDIKLYFKDGTGDLGLKQGDTLGIYKSRIDSIKKEKVTWYKHSRNHNNYWLDIYVKKNGTYVQVKSPDEYHLIPANFFIHDGRFLPFNDSYVTDRYPLEGFLNYKFDYYKNFDPANITHKPDIEPNDTVMFKIRILDRKLNISNTVSTSEFILFQ